MSTLLVAVGTGLLAYVLGRLHGYRWAIEVMIQARRRATFPVCDLTVPVERPWPPNDARRRTPTIMVEASPARAGGLVEPVGRARRRRPVRAT